MELCYQQTCEQEVTGKEFFHKINLGTEKGQIDRKMGKMDRQDRWTDMTDGQT